MEEVVFIHFTLPEQQELAVDATSIIAFGNGFIILETRDKFEVEEDYAYILQQIIAAYTVLNGGEVDAESE